MKGKQTVDRRIDDFFWNDRSLVASRRALAQELVAPLHARFGEPEGSERVGFVGFFFSPALSALTRTRRKKPRRVPRVGAPPRPAPLHRGAERGAVVRDEVVGLSAYRAHIGLRFVRRSVRIGSNRFKAARSREGSVPADGGFSLAVARHLDLRPRAVLGDREEEGEEEGREEGEDCSESGSLSSGGGGWRGAGL